MDPQVPTENSPTVTPLPNNHLVTILSTLLIIAGMIATFFYFQVQKLSKELAKYQIQPTAMPSATPTTEQECVEKESLNCANEPELSYECTTEYQDWAVTNCPGWEEEQFCGGITGRVCPEGYSCKLDGNYPDAGGVCTKLIEQIPPISKSELLMGWYYGTKDQKKKNTPTTWVYTEAGKSSCWHKINTQCRFLPD